MSRPKIFALLYSLQEAIANWRVPCSNKLMRHWMDKFNEKISNPESQRRIVLVVVCIALFLDNMLYMVIVPIIPVYLRKIHAFGPDITVTSFINETVNASELYSSRSTTSMISTNANMFSHVSMRAGTTIVPPVTASPVKRLTSNNTVNRSIKTQGSLDQPSSIEDFSPVTSPPSNNTIIRSIKLYASVYQPSSNEDVNVGVLFACKAIFQLLINPFTGTLMDRIGYDIPMMIGLSIIFFSTSMFAFGASYGTLFVARSLQGIGSAFADTSGLAMIADRFQQDKERSRALGLALAFISFGSLVAPPFGGTLYEFAGKAVPFLILALIALGDGGLMLLAMKPVRKERSELKKENKLPRGTPIYKLIVDPNIAVCAGCLVMANVSLAFIEPTIAIWMKDTMDAPEWQIGLIWLPAFPPHVLGVFVTVKLAERFPKMQWLMAGIGLALEGVSCMIIPFCTTFAMLMLPLSILCFGIALVDTAVLPLMAHLVDVRHVSVYGSVYAIADISYSMAYAFGPILAGQVVKTIGFTALNAGIFVSNIVYAPLLALLRNAYDYEPFKVQEDALVEGNTPNHVLYKTYSSNEPDQDNLDLSEQTTAFIPNGKTHNSSAVDIRMSSDYGYGDRTMQSNLGAKTLVHADADYGYDDAFIKQPQPAARKVVSLDSSLVPGFPTKRAYNSDDSPCSAASSAHGSDADC